jgi:hypothetical protein
MNAVVAGDLAVEGVDQERKLSEREERDAERQRDGDCRMAIDQPSEVLDEKAGVFEIAKKGQIEHDAPDQNCPCRGPAPVGDALGDRGADFVVDGDRDEQGDEIFRIPVGVKEI